TPVNVVTIDVASHEAQARYAVSGHVQVVANLPGALVFAIKVGNLNGVVQPDGTAAIYEAIAVAGVTRRALVSQGEGVSADVVGGCQAPDLVVDLAGQFVAFVGGAVEVEVEVQRLLFGQWQGVVQVQVGLLVIVLEVTVMDGGA